MRRAIGVNSGAFSKTIWVGELNKAQTAFTTKQDGTEMVLAAVARYVWDHCDADLTCEIGGFEMQIIVQPAEKEI